MKNVRVIARLDIKGPNLVKGIHLEGLRVLGKPEDFADHYYRCGIDELIYMDAVASLYGRNSTLDLVRRTAEKVLVPLCVGGGLRSLEDIYQVLRSGADKVSLNTAAIRDPGIITEAAHRFGSSTIVVAVEAIRQPGGEYLAYVNNGREHTGRDAFDWACEAASRGAGEILVTAVDREGTGKGFDMELVARIAGAVSVPVIAHGGAGTVQDVIDVVQNASADAVALASLIHYDTILQLENTVGTGEGNTAFLKSGRGFSKVRPTSVGNVKQSMTAAGIRVRP
jgi:imidazole glycerol-phosphate synthase subunit HisF